MSTLIKVWLTTLAFLLMTFFVTWVYGMLYYPHVTTEAALHYGFFWVIIASFVGFVLTTVVGGVVALWEAF